MKILELYSGIGGMHTAFKMSQREGEVLCAIDINQTANKVYAHNYPATTLINGNIQGLTPKRINKMHIDTILMSPPCQPFTRNGLQMDILDPRTKSFQHLLNILPELHIKQLLMENVKGFEQSEMHHQFVTLLKDCGFHYKEFIISPHQFGVPNSRMRYYCVARKEPFTTTISSLPVNELEVMQDAFALKMILEDETSDECMVPMKELLKRCKLLDIVYADSTRSCCFTKSYGRYIEGTGSVFTPQDKSDVDNVFARLEEVTICNDDAGELQAKSKEELLKRLSLRFFTPREVCRLMCFPDEFGFPADVTNRQRYMLLGNSINCKVVSELIKLL